MKYLKNLCTKKAQKHFLKNIFQIQIMTEIAVDIKLIRIHKSTHYVFVDILFRKRVFSVLGTDSLLGRSFMSIFKFDGK